MEQHLFTTEFAEGGANLQGAIRARHPAGVLTQYDGGFPYEYALLLAALLSLDALGGDKRCWFWVDVRFDSKRRQCGWNSQHISSDEAFQSFKDETRGNGGSLLEMLRRGIN